MSHLRISTATILLIVLIHAFSVSQEKYDIIHLKSGGKIVGRILEKTENQPVRMELQSKEILEVPWDTIKDFGEVFPATQNVSTPQVSMVTLVPLKKSFAKDTAWVVSLRTGGIKSNVSLDSLNGSNLFVSSHNVVDTIDVALMKELRLVRTSHWGLYVGGGTLAGMVVGGVLASDNSSEPSKEDPLGIAALGKTAKTMGGILAGGAVGFVLGAMVGTSQGTDIVFDMSENNLAGSINLIEDIFRK